MKVRITKEFSFETAHQLEGYDGKCRNIHGHSYKLFVTIIGTPITDPSSPKLGMLMDFADLKKIVNTHIVDVMDHAIVLRRGCTLEHQLYPVDTRVVLVDYQPTCEQMVGDFAKTIQQHLPEGLKVHSIKLHETATSYAEWYAQDNE